MKNSTISAIIQTGILYYPIDVNMKGAFMKISYKKLWMLLIQRDITKVKLKRDLGLAAGTMSKLNKGEDVALSVLLRIGDYLDCDIGDICEAVRTNDARS